MSVLVIGGDNINSIKPILSDLGVENITHWDGRKNHGCGRSIPEDTDYLLMLTTFLNHNMMKKYKKLAKKENISLVCAKKSVGSVQDEFKRAMNRA